MFHVHQQPSGGCEIRFAFQGRAPEAVTREERRAFIRLGPSLAAVNAWLTALGADGSRAGGTGREYAKVLKYALEWLALEPVRLGTREPVGHSLLTLGRTELRALFAWLDLPARRAADRERLARTGELPPGFRSASLSAATRNLRAAALAAFYDYLITEYLPARPADGHPLVGEGADADGRLPATNPLAGSRRTPAEAAGRPDGLLPRRRAPEDAYRRQFRRPDGRGGPLALSPAELQLVLAAVPAVSHGRNAANRNGALVRLLLWGMLRTAELVAASWEAVDGEVLWVVGKGGKRRAVPIGDPGAWGYLQAYTNELRLPPERRFRGPLLRQLDHEDRPLTSHTVEHLVLALRAHFRAGAEAAARAGDQAGTRVYTMLAGKLRAHIFRATGATFMAAAGMELIKLAALLGHSDPGTTLRYYIAADQLALPEAVRQICARIAGTLDEAVPAAPDPVPTDRLSWYRRRGLVPNGEGGPDGASPPRG